MNYSTVGQDQQSQSQLVISLHNVEFAKEYNYFITVQLETEKEKRRTDVSACVTNPVFTASVFVIPLQNGKIHSQERLHLAAFVVTDRDAQSESIKQELENKGQARLLGEVVLEMGPLANILTDIGGAGHRRQLKFQRMQGDKQVTVGRLIVNMKVVGEEILPVNQEYKQLDKDEIFHELPRPDPFFDFSWRLRVDM